MTPVPASLELRQIGRLRIGRCPYHDDQHASFTVYPDDSYFCFGCGAHGRLGDAPKTVTPLLKAEPTRRGLRYPQAWADNPKAAAYFGGRGLTPETVRRFRLGYDGWRFTIPCFGADGVLHGVKRRRDPDNT